jgi:hypothetical protein
MFYSHTVEDSKFNLFTSLLSAVAEGKQEYASYVNGVIKEAHSFLTGEKTMLDLDKDTFSIVVYLSENDADFLKQIETDSIKREDYIHIREVLKQDNILVY